MGEVWLAEDTKKGHNIALLDTRKTTPGLRPLEKYAVRLGGAQNHRFAFIFGLSEP